MSTISMNMKTMRMMRNLASRGLFLLGDDDSLSPPLFFPSTGAGEEDEEVHEEETNDNLNGIIKHRSII